MFGYKWDGKYWKDGDGNRISEQEYQDVIKKAREQMQLMFGGYLKK